MRFSTMVKVCKTIQITAASFSKNFFIYFVSTSIVEKQTNSEKIILGPDERLRDGRLRDYG